MEALVETLRSGDLVEADAVSRSHFSAVSEFYPLMAFVVKVDDAFLAGSVITHTRAYVL